MKKLRVVLADDHPGVLDTIQRLLPPSFEVVKTVSNGVALCKALETFQPDIAVVDVSMPELNGIRAVKQSRKSGFTGKIVMLSICKDAALVDEALAAGAQGYVHKEIDGQGIAACFTKGDPGACLRVDISPQ